jgi:hypothetical protein
MVTLQHIQDKGKMSKQSLIIIMITSNIGAALREGWNIIAKMNVGITKI